MVSPHGHAVRCRAVCTSVAYSANTRTVHTAPSIPTIRALTSLDISNNKLVAESDYIEKNNHGLNEGDLVEYNGAQCPVSWTISNEYKVLDISGAILLAGAIKNSRALTSLNLSHNNLVPEHYDDKMERISDITGIKALAAAIAECK